MIEIHCKHCNEQVSLVSGPSSDIELNEFLGTGVWLYLHLKKRHPQILDKKLSEEAIDDVENFIKEIKKLYGTVFFEV